MLDSTRATLTTVTYEFANDVITSAESTDNQVIILNADKSIDLQAKARYPLKYIIYSYIY